MTHWDENDPPRGLGCSGGRLESAGPGRLRVGDRPGRWGCREPADLAVSLEPLARRHPSELALSLRSRAAVARPPGALRPCTVPGWSSHVSRSRNHPTAEATNPVRPSRASQWGRSVWTLLLPGPLARHQQAPGTVLPLDPDHRSPSPGSHPSQTPRHKNMYVFPSLVPWLVTGPRCRETWC